MRRLLSLRELERYREEDDPDYERTMEDVWWEEHEEELVNCCREELVKMVDEKGDQSNKNIIAVEQREELKEEVTGLICDSDGDEKYFDGDEQHFTDVHSGSKQAVCDDESFENEEANNLEIAVFVPIAAQPSLATILEECVEEHLTEQEENALQDEDDHFLNEDSLNDDEGGTLWLSVLEEEGESRDLLQPGGGGRRRKEKAETRDEPPGKQDETLTEEYELLQHPLLLHHLSPAEERAVQDMDSAILVLERARQEVFLQALEGCPLPQPGQPQDWKCYRPGCVRRGRHRCSRCLQVISYLPLSP